MTSVGFQLLIVVLVFNVGFVSGAAWCGFYDGESK